MAVTCQHTCGEIYFSGGVLTLLIQISRIVLCLHILLLGAARFGIGFPPPKRCLVTPVPLVYKEQRQKKSQGQKLAPHRQAPTQAAIPTDNLTPAHEDPTRARVPAAKRRLQAVVFGKGTL